MLRSADHIKKSFLLLILFFLEKIVIKMGPRINLICKFFSIRHQSINFSTVKKLMALLILLKVKTSVKLQLSLWYNCNFRVVKRQLDEL